MHNAATAYIHAVTDCLFITLMCQRVVGVICSVSPKSSWFSDKTSGKQWTVILLLLLFFVFIIFIHF